MERMWVPKTGLCALRESGKTPNTITGACLACSGHVVQTGLLFVLAALLFVALMVGAERNLDFLTLMVGASQFVMLLQSLTVLEKLDVEWPAVVGKLVLFLPSSLCSSLSHSVT